MIKKLSYITRKPLPKKIGQFRVTKDLGFKIYGTNNKNKRRRALVECTKCGVRKEGDISNIRNMNPKGCKYEHRSSRYNPVTEEWTRLRHIRRKMIHRCFDKEDFSYKTYGALGIRVCDEWKKSKEAFYKWSMENGYKNNLTIDRIDNNKGYSPDNCRWTTLSEQARNKRNTLSVDKVKEIKTLLKSGMINYKIAEIIGTSKCRVDDISSGRSWKHINI